MGEYISVFSSWVYHNYGKMGWLIILLTIAALIGVVIFCVNKSDPKEPEEEWSRCETCKYDYNKKQSTVIMCTKYKKKPFLQRKKRICPRLDSSSDRSLFDEIINNKDAIQKD